MTFRSATRNDKGRAHSPEDKARVRQAFIDAGKQLMRTEEPESVSLRRIASAAGYSPGTIYQYFHDHRELLFAIRELDMNAATDLIEAAAHGEQDPKTRVRKLFLGSVNYWLEHLDHFDLLFSGPLPQGLGRRADAPVFGRSSSVQRSLKLYRDAVDAFFRSLRHRPMSTIKATDILIATSHGVIAFPRLTASMDWSDTRSMAEFAIDALLDAWQRAGQEPRASAHR